MKCLGFFALWVFCLGSYSFGLGVVCFLQVVCGEDFLDTS